MNGITTLDHSPKFLFVGMWGSIISGVRIIGLAASGFVLVNVILRLAYYRPMFRKLNDSIAKHAFQQTSFLETIRGITSIKLFGAIHNREILWKNLLASATKSDVLLQRLKINYGFLNNITAALARVSIVYLAVSLGLKGELTIGMIFAVMSYGLTFSQSAISALEAFLNFKLLDLHLERISDIALASTEENPPEATIIGRGKIKGNFDSRALFRVV